MSIHYLAVVLIGVFLGQGGNSLAANLSFPENLPGRIEYGEQGESIRILDEEKAIFEYPFDEFKNWAVKNWDNLFPKPPSFGNIVTIYPDDFAFFDRSASLSSDGKTLAFSVHRYFAASFASYVGIVDIDTREVNLINKTNMGNIDKLIWSKDGTHLAYTLHTGRAAGDYLSVDNMKEMIKKFTLSEDDIAKFISPLSDGYMPCFDILKWCPGTDRLIFTTSDPQSTESGKNKIYWSIDKQGNNLIKEGRFTKESK